jgi:hypothetical protein
MGFCTLCEKRVRHLFRHQRTRHPLDYQPPLTMGDQFYCEECKHWWAFNQWRRHYRSNHDNQMPSGGRPKPGDENYRSAVEANKSIQMEYDQQLRAKSNVARQNQEVVLNIDEESGDGSSVVPIDEDNTQDEGQSARSLDVVSSPFGTAIQEGRLKPFQREYEGQTWQQDRPRLYSKEQGSAPDTSNWIEMACKGLYHPQTSVFRSGEASNPLQGFEHRVLQSLYRPDLSEVYFAINIPMEDVKDRPPTEFLDKQTIHTKKYEWMGNLTPEGSFVDLHIGKPECLRIVFLTKLVTDLGMHVYSVNDKNCVKDWALYPPNENNLNNFFRSEGQQKKFQRLENQLIDGEWLRQGPGGRIYVPPGWIHSTYTRVGGVLAGVNWVSAEALPVVTSVVIHEREQGSVQSWHDVIIFLYTFLQSVRSGLTTLWEPAVEKICGWENMSKPLTSTAESKQIFKELQKLLHRQGYTCDKRVCRKCPREVMAHFEEQPSTRAGIVRKGAVRGKRNS